MATTAKTGKPGHSQAGAIKDTLVGVIISFVMAFVFRGFVIEGFQIPTGSMAPTLLGKHVLIHNPDTGSEWAVGPWDYVGGRQAQGVPPLPRQGAQTRPNRSVTDPITVNDPALDPRSGGVLTRENERLRSGDRIFIIKYLYGINDPRRWDVCVFKNPADQQNFIKRLIGLPGEQIALVDGDVFARPFVEGETSVSGVHAWEEGGWSVQRKNERTQRAMLQTVFDSRRTPPNPGPSFTPGWKAGGAGAWEGLRDRASYTHARGGAGELVWDRPITDWYPYNQTAKILTPEGPNPLGPFPVSDVAMSLGFEPEGEGARVEAHLSARGREFRARVADGVGAVEMRARGADAWTTLDSGDAGALRAGEVTDVEFWHIDQALWLFVGGDLVAGGPEDGAYDLSPAERFEAAAGRTLGEALDSPGLIHAQTYPSPLSDPGLYKDRDAGVRWSFDSPGAYTVHRVKLARDIHYQVHMRSATFGGDPRFFPTLGEDQFFVCGDNSPSSEDSRLWGASGKDPDPWISDQMDDTPGVVARDLMLGRAFVVYFPSPLRAGRFPVPIPDLGRVRWIW